MEAKMAASGQMASGAVQAMWRYPVKSMMGEEIASGEVTARGLASDRAYALVEQASNRAAPTRTWAARLLQYRAQFLTEPAPDRPAPAVRITCPDGTLLTSTEADLEARLSADFGRALRFMAVAPAGLLVEFPAGTLAGTLAHLTELPLAAAAPAGTFFDYACLHLIATATLDHLQRVYPQGRFDGRRFRPNFVIRTTGEPFIENSWAGRTVAIGAEVVLRVTIPTGRCGVTTQPQGDLPQDPGILRTIAQHNLLDSGEFGRSACLGVYADVVKPGVVRCGDTLRFLD
jgi:uncharacterized protein YcbX